MRKGAWQKRIIEDCKQAGTYREYFDKPITNLAEILELRDDAIKQFKASGGQSIILKQSGQSDPIPVKNPALVIIDDLTKTALAYWRDLGLTPSGLKRIDEKSMKQKKKSALAEALKGV